MSAGTAPGAVSRPASISSTRRDGSSDSRAATTAPAEPPPTTTTSASCMPSFTAADWSETDRGGGAASRGLAQVRPDQPPGDDVAQQSNAGAKQRKAQRCASDFERIAG